MVCSKKYDGFFAKQMMKVYLMKEQFIKQTISQDICLVKKLMKYRL